jgi:hypothetical protein
METLGMKPMATLLAGLLLAGSAGAGDVYVTKDAQGRTIYTDTPQTIPAQKLDIHSQSAESAAAAQGTAAQAKQPSQQSQSSSAAPSSQAAAQQAAQTTAEDKAKRCMDARQRYQTLMDNWRVYEPGPNGERTYLTSEQLDAARANAKTAMDEFCSDQ